MKHSRSFVTFALLGTLVSGAAFAHGIAPQDASGSGAPAFLDISKDGKSIKRSDIPKDVDALKELRAHFNEADLNHDGRVDESEYDAYINKNSQRPQSQQ